MEEIKKLANAYGLQVIEDAACGLEPNCLAICGNLGSWLLQFSPRKAITTGEGGMITTNNSEMNEKLRTLRDHGATMSDMQRHHGEALSLAEHTTAGFNARMTD